MKLSVLLRKKASLSPTRVLLPEGEDPRIREAAATAAKEGFCRPVILSGNNPLSGVETADPGDPSLKKRAASVWSKIKKIPLEKAIEKMENRLNLSTALLHSGFADAMVCGAASPTAEVLRPSLELRKLYPGIPPVTSCFFMETTAGVLVFSDCGMNPEPSAAMLAQIANSAAQAAEKILELKPVTAMLSFSTKGSADSASVLKVREAVGIARKKFPALLIDGELQADAALVPWIGEKKAPGSPVAGKANVLVFPDLNSGNIAYKLVERLAGARAMGPVILGLNPPVNDLSRGCSAEDIADICAIASIQAGLNE